MAISGARSWSGNVLDVVTAAISELATFILSAQDTAGQCPLNTLENIGRHREELGEVVWNAPIYSNLVSASNKINKTMVDS